MKKQYVISCLIMLLLQFSLLPAESAKMDRPITAWPFLYHSSETNQAETTLLLLLRYERRYQWSRYALRPFLFSAEFDPGKDYQKISLLWPLNIYEQEGETRSFHSFPFYWYKNAPNDRYNILFPFYWKGEDHNSSYFHLWPLFGINRSNNTLTEYSTLYPFFRYKSDVLGRELDVHFPWPIANYHRKGLTFSHRLLPLYWIERGPDQSRGFVFPYYWRKTVSHSAQGIFPLWYSSSGPGLKTDLVFPFYFNRETPKSQLRMITPLYLSRKTNDSHLRILFPLWYSLHKARLKTNLVFPFYFNRETPKSQLRMITPLYFSRTADDGHFRTLLPLYLDYKKADVGLKIGLPLYYHYQNDAFTFSTFLPFYFRATDSRKETDFRYYFPLYGRFQRGEQVTRRFFLFPLYANYNDEGLNTKGWDILWPFFHYDTSPEESSLRLLPFYWASETEDYQFRFSFPFYWSYSSAQNSYRHFLPFYGIHKKGDGYSKRFILGPLYIKTEDKRSDLIQHDVLYPLFSSKQEGEESLTWLLPLWMHQSTPRHTTDASLFLHWYKRDHESDSTRLSFLWLIPPDTLPRRPGIFVPGLSLIWYESTPGLTRHGFFPLYSYKQDVAAELEFSQFLLFFRKHETQKSLIGIIPLWMHQSSPQHTTDASLFLHWYKHDQTNDKTSLSFLWLIPPDTLQRRPGSFVPGLSLIRYTHSPTLTRHAFFPLYSYEKDTAANSIRWSFLSPLISYQSDGVLSSETGFLWKVITYEQKDAETSDFRFLWRLIRWSKTKDSVVFEFNPLYSYESKKGEGSYWSILGGLIGKETAEDGSSKMRWFWFL